MHVKYVVVLHDANRLIIVFLYIVLPCNPHRWRIGWHTRPPRWIRWRCCHTGCSSRQDPLTVRREDERRFSLALTSRYYTTSYDVRLACLRRKMIHCMCKRQRWRRSLPSAACTGPFSACTGRRCSPPRSCKRSCSRQGLTVLRHCCRPFQGGRQRRTWCTHHVQAFNIGRYGDLMFSFKF